jgi:hypothetical protein
MQTLTIDHAVIDHTECPPSAHRTTADVNEDATADGGILCLLCGGALFHCARAANANATQPGYHRTYIHTDPRREETC